MSDENDASVNAREQANAQARSIAEMVAALDVDYDRLEELREKRKAGHYVAGYNMPGYMPDADPAQFDDANDAREWLADEMQRIADDDAPDAEQPEGADLDEVARLREVCDELEGAMRFLREDDADEAGADYGRTMGKWHYWLTFVPNELSDAAERDELAELEDEAGECENEDEARERIMEDPLEVQVRSDWHAPGELHATPSEFYILLCTGGPAVRIMGELDDALQPSRAWIEYQDWGTPWTHAVSIPLEQSTLLRYCAQFYYGE